MDENCLFNKMTCESHKITNDNDEKMYFNFSIIVNQSMGLEFPVSYLYLLLG